MTTKTTSRDDRIEMGTTADHKADGAERVRLSERDSARVLKLLENPPKPTKALLAAAARRART